MTTRRDLLKFGAAAALSSVAARLGAQTRAPRRILLLGGTGFLGPHVVHAAVSRGHHLTMLNRGQRAPNQNAGDYAKVEAIRPPPPERF